MSVLFKKTSLRFVNIPSVCRVWKGTGVTNKLEADTRLAFVEGDERSARYAGALHPDWQVWFPNGGYMGAMLLRAGSEFSSFERPLSFSCHFLSVPRIGEVELQVASLRKTRFAESLSLTMRQGEKVVVQALAWFGEPVEGYEHDDAVMPAVPALEACRATIEIRDGHAPHPFWNMIEQRPTTGDLHWQLAQSGQAEQRDWIRFLPDEPSDLAIIDMARYVVLLDTYAWPAAARAHAGDGRYIAPTLSLNIEFHREFSGSWMLSDASVPVAAAGYMGASNRLWSKEGNLLASAVATLMCRPRPA